jgi:DNA-binding transcriptional ArsR family regulator
LSDNSVISRQTDEGVVRLLAATAEPSRLALLRLLAERERGVRECADRTGLAPDRVRRHLVALVSAGLLQRRDMNGMQSYRLLDAEGVQTLLDAGDRLAQDRSCSN